MIMIKRGEQVEIPIIGDIFNIIKASVENKERLLFSVQIPMLPRTSIFQYFNMANLK